MHFNTLFEKSNFYPKIQLWQNPKISWVFHPKFYSQIFSWNQSYQQLKSSKPQHFHEFFTRKKSTIFSWNQSWIIGQKMKISNSVDCGSSISRVSEISKREWKPVSYWTKENCCLLMIEVMPKLEISRKKFADMKRYWKN